MSKIIDISGERFGRLKVIKFHSRTTGTYFLCICDCGKEILASSNNLKAGKYKSCGCYRNEFVKTVNKVHGDSYTPFYNVYRSMKARCHNKNNSHYRYYGGRGIKNLWRSFQHFKDDMYESYLDHRNIYGKDTTLERINTEGDYSKENCRWATVEEQQNNKRNNKIIVFKDKRLTATQWANFLNTSKPRFFWRLKNWPLENAMNGIAPKPRIPWNKKKF